jgi:maleate isomerase
MNHRPAHAGVLVPWANSVVEAELHRVSGPSVTWHYARLVPASGTTGLDGQFLRGLLDAVPAALGQLSALSLERVYLACTSAAFMHPEAADSARREAPLTLVSAFDALRAMLSKLPATRIALLTPYPAEVTKAEVQMFESRGITVTGSASLGLSDGYGTLSPDQVMSLIPEAGHAAIDKAEAIVLSCTGWPTLDLIQDLYRDLGKPVLSSNSAIGLHAQEREIKEERCGPLWPQR